MDQNGVIILYEVQYEPLMTFGGGLMTMTMNTSDTSVVVGELQEYVQYNISVRAYTSVGHGPFSPSVDNRTFEDGKYTKLYSCTGYIVTCTPFFHHLCSTKCSSRQCTSPHSFLNCYLGDVGPSTRDIKEWNHHPV